METIKIRILKYLLDNKKTQNITSISKGINTNYSNTYQNIKQLEELELINLGNNIQVKLKNKLTENIYIAETERKKELLKSETFQNIQHKLNKINNPFFITLLFGSAIKNEDSNDIDLCIITNELKDEIIEELQTLSYNLDINTFTIEEFKQMIKSKEENLGNEIMENNVILKGIENYYEIIK